jgi:hypothetical protein
MPIELFGFSIGRKKAGKLPPEDKKIKTFTQPENEDGAFVLEGGGFGGYGSGHFQTVIDFDQAAKNELESITKYREMVMHPEVESAVEDILNESIVYDEEKRSVELSLDKIENKDLSKNIKTKVHDEYDALYAMLQFENKGYEIFRRWYVDGKIYYHMVVDEKNTKKGILDIKYVDPTRIQKIVETEKKKEGEVEVIVKKEEYFLYKEDPTHIDGLKIAPEAVCFVTSGLYDAANRRVLSYLHKAIKPLNQLRMVEDAVVIYRLSRAPERRVFYIDVGSLPKTKAEQYVRSIMNKYRNKLVYDADTGEIRDDKRHMSMLEDFWLPRREGGKGTEISTLDGGQNLGEMDDVEYFQKRLYQALSIPKTRLEMDSGFSLGRASEINRDEVKFQKFVERLRNKFNDLFKIMLKTQCLLKGIMTEEDWDAIDQDIAFEYAKDNHFAELKEYELINERMTVLRDVNDYIGKYYSVEWVRKNILRQSDKDIKELDKEIAQEREEGIISDEAEY